MLKRSVTFGIAVGLVACVPKKPVASVAKSDSAEVPVSLGLGYDTELIRNKDECITFEKRALGGTGLNYTFERVESLANKKSSFGFDSSISLSYAIAKGKATAGFATSLDETTFTSTYLLDVTAMMGSDQAINPVIKADTKDLSKFRMKCGDKYVSQVTQGGRLMVAVTFMFADKATKDSFNTSFSLGFTGVKLGAEAEVKVQKALEMANEKTSIKITLNQKGGDPGKLTEVFPSGEDVMLCDIKNRDKCKDTIAKLFNYAVKFSNWVQEKPYVYSYQLEDYPGLGSLPTIGSPEVAGIKESTADMLLESRKESQILNDLMTYQEGYGTASRKEEIRKAKDAVDRNIDKLRVNISNCVENNAGCKALEQLGLADIDPQLLVTAGDLINSGSIGGNGGGEVVQACDDFVSGLHGESGWILDRAGAVCSNGKKFDKLGTGYAGEFVKTCQPGSVVVGLKGSREDYKKTKAVGSLVLQCASLDSVRAKTPSISEVVVFSGDEARTEQSCPPGSAAKEIRFRAGKWIDSVELNCVQVL